MRAARREPVERTPVWFMRQAGRSLPEYRELRKQYGLFEVCRQPELCAEVTLQPVRAPRRRRGGDVRGHHAPGPRDGHRRRAGRERRARRRRARAHDGRRRAPARPRARRSRFRSCSRRSGSCARRCGTDQAVVGFAGGPFTVAGYLIEGKPTREFKLTKACMYGEPEVWHALMEKLARDVRALRRRVRRARAPT